MLLVYANTLPKVPRSQSHYDSFLMRIIWGAVTFGLAATPYGLYQSSGCKECQIKLGQRAKRLTNEQVQSSELKEMLMQCLNGSFLVMFIFREER